MTTHRERARQIMAECSQAFNEGVPPLEDAIAQALAAVAKDALERAAKVAESEWARKLDGNLASVEAWHHCARKITESIRALAQEDTP